MTNSNKFKIILNTIVAVGLAILAVTTRTVSEAGLSAAEGFTTHIVRVLAHTGHSQHFEHRMP